MHSKLLLQQMRAVPRLNYKLLDGENRGTEYFVYTCSIAPQQELKSSGLAFSTAAAPPAFNNFV